MAVDSDCDPKVQGIKTYSAVHQAQSVAGLLSMLCIKLFFLEISVAAKGSERWSV